jgi:hypothetical protein
MVRRLAAATCLACLVAGAGPALMAQTRVGTEIAYLCQLQGQGEAPEGEEAKLPAFFNQGTATLEFNSTVSPEIKGQLELSARLSDTLQLDIKRAWMKARLAPLRLTAGKTRTSWGQGEMFNSGDVVFRAETFDLSAETIRDETTWLVSLYAPLGDYSFIELLGLPPALPVEDMLKAQAQPQRYAMPDLPTWEDFSGGGRWQFKLAELQAELGYVWNGPAKAHRPMLSVQAHALVDWQLSSSLDLPGNPDDWNDDSPKSWKISAGLFHQIPLTASTGEADLTETSSSTTLNLRLECRIEPFGDWSAIDTQDPTPGGTALAAGESRISTDYGLLLYPEIALRSDSVFCFIRALISPVDGSAILGAGAQWTPLQGFTILGNVCAQLGDANDLFHLERQGGWRAQLGTRLNF